MPEEVDVAVGRVQHRLPRTRLAFGQGDFAFVVLRRREILALDVAEVDLAAPGVRDLGAQHPGDIRQSQLRLRMDKLFRQLVALEVHEVVPGLFPTHGGQLAAARNTVDLPPMAFGDEAQHDVDRTQTRADHTHGGLLGNLPRQARYGVGVVVVAFMVLIIPGLQPFQVAERQIHVPRAQGHAGLRLQHVVFGGEIRRRDADDLVRDRLEPHSAFGGLASGVFGEVRQV